MLARDAPWLRVFCAAEESVKGGVVGGRREAKGHDSGTGEFRAPSAGAECNWFPNALEECAGGAALRRRHGACGVMNLAGRSECKYCRGRRDRQGGQLDCWSK